MTLVLLLQKSDRGKSAQWSFTHVAACAVFLVLLIPVVAAVLAFELLMLSRI